MFAFLENLDKDIRQALLSQLRNLWTHASTAIEGNSLTLDETAYVLEKGQTVSGKPIKDHQEVVGHARAIDLVYRLIAKNAVLTEQDLFDLHKAVQTEWVMDVYKPLGAWKKEPNSTVMVSGENQVIFEYAHPQDVPALMRAWLALFAKLIGSGQTDRDAALEAYIRLHVAFVRIHPFWDGNGRIARLASNIPVLRAGYPPIIIPRERRRDYIQALSEYHLAAGAPDAANELLPMVHKLERFKRFCADSYAASVQLVEAAHAKQQKRNQKGCNHHRFP